MDAAVTTVGLGALCATAGGVGLVHTLLGPDHYIPFIAMARAGKWSLARTMLVTFLCGLGHVGSSVVLGLVGIAVGAAVFKLEAIEAVRGDLAGWLLLAFGLAYFAWGVRQAIRNRPHTHLHAHADGTVHAHPHAHRGAHVHVHPPAAAEAPAAGSPDAPDAVRLTPWILFTVFVFGPCEPLIPLVMVPAARHSSWGVAWVTLVFGIVTIGTMMTVVAIAWAGAERLRLGRFERYSHALAGGLLTACGAAVLLGL